MPPDVQGETNRLLTGIPNPSGKRIAVHVTPGAERALRKGHPWLFADGIREQSHTGSPGDLAIVFDKKRRFLAIGLYDPHSPIRVLILKHREPETIDRNWLQQRLAEAASRRAALPATDTDGYRLVHGENDGLPGLVIDRYASTLVVKLYSTAWIPWLAPLWELLPAIQPHERCVLRLSRLVGQHPEALHGLSDGLILSGPSLDAPVLFRENGLRFEVDPIRGQKTGFFLDQRDNRARVGALAKGLDVLNVFSYSGGFSLYAAQGGARNVVSLDLSKPALEAAKRNFALNQDHPGVRAGNHETMAADAFAALQNLAQARQTYDMVIVDPPSLVKDKEGVSRALAAYSRLVTLALAVLRRNGILVMASCSSRVTADDFFAAVLSTARECERPLTEIERTGHALDHPITFPEGAYLKCLFARV